MDPLIEPVSAHDHGVAEFAVRFEALSAEDQWGPVRDLIPVRPGAFALDIGAGTGRDAAWLASLGLDVVAAEPAEDMRAEGARRHPGLRWIDDRLPDLTRVHRLGLGFDFVLLSAAWAHLLQRDRRRAFRKMTTLLKPGGVLLMTLRHGPGAPGRPMYEASLGEVEALARDFGLGVVRVVADRPDPLGLFEVTWTLIVLRLPDDGSMGLPLIRGIILNDSKTATYKLGLLRAVAKIADSAPSLAVHAADESDQVEVPLGMVALNWVRAYLPLVGAGLPQLPRNSGPDGLGFAKSGFRALMGLNITAQDLRVGASFTGERASALCEALGEASRTIVKNPAHFTTLPNSTTPVFGPALRSPKPTGPVSLTAEFLVGWGTLSVPGHLWRTMLRLGTWIEPVLLAEWISLTRGFATRMGLDLAPGVIEASLIWQDPVRDTGLARDVARRLEEAGAPIACVWSGQPLTLQTLDIDHALPWTAWPCGDLWNLVPCLRSVNQHQKRDRLPTASALAAARDPIIQWWDAAWRADPALARQFAAEARAALPLEGDVTPDAVFAGLEWRRLRVRQDQQAPEWDGVIRSGVTHRL
jgi:SAM-dependent methyltransferase